jgi:general L-amino acid transport system permease protein
VNTARLHGLAWQAVVLILAAVAILLVTQQARTNLTARGIAQGFGYLGRPAGFEIAPGVLAYSSRRTYARALAVGLVNTLRVSALAMAIATVLGLGIGVARMSRHRAVAAAAAAAIEALRNTPLLLQLFCWHSLWRLLPGPLDPLRLWPGIWLCRRGIHLAGPWGSPTMTHFGVQGGLWISPEFATLLIGLSIGASVFIGEIVRGGVLAIDRGQSEAAAALGLSRRQTLRHVLLPQAVPMMVPPMTSQFVNVVKNSSLGVAIGYPDLISLTSTTLNQTGQAIEAIGVAMTCYVGIGLVLSAAMRAWERSRA